MITRLEIKPIISKSVEAVRHRLKASKKWIIFFLNREQVVGVYKSLSPIDSADSGNTYLHALRWALKNRRKEGIRNIAVTGPYGSGKSSILKSFQKRYPNSNWRYLNISLATFKEEKEKNDPLREAEVLRLIEVSILQQIFYHERDEKIPDSRFKKIKSFGKWHRLWIASAVFVFLVAVLHFFYPFFLNELLKDVPINPKVKLILHYGKFAVIICGLFLIILNSVRTITAITISKLKINDAEIGFGDNKNKSALNHHLDEILYFFEVTKYNVVFIEDLDRFQETEIFTKLREINLLLNNSKKTSKLDVAFVYAVRDEMFRDKDRTKFFDFIIPIIPVINSSNSGQILISKRDANGYKITNDFIDQISLFIDDMRLLHNVANEFHLFKVMLDPQLNEDRLMAMIIYKNIMPSDFVDLAKSEGRLYHCLASRNAYILAELDRIDVNVNEKKESIKNLESLLLTNVHELRKLYILHKLEGVNKFQTFVVNGSPISFDNLADDNNFQYVIDDEVKYHQLSDYSGTREMPVPKKFKDIEKALGVKTYQNRLTEINDWNKQKADQLREEIKTLEASKLQIRNAKLKDILRLSNSEKLLEDLLKDSGNDTPKTETVSLSMKRHDKELIKVLLRNSYIGEDYNDYISIFHEGTLTRNDNQFLICIRGQTSLPIDYKLTQIDNIIKKIALPDFEKEYALNIDLLNFMLKDNQYVEKLDHIFIKLSDQSNTSIDFIEAFTATTPHEKEFFKRLSHSWKGSWKYLRSISHFSNERKQYYLKSILSYGDLEDIAAIATGSSLVNDLNEDNSFLSILEDPNKTKAIIDKLKLKFSSLNLEKAPSSLVDHIIEKQCYELNLHMIRSILITKGKFDPLKFDTQNYNVVTTSGVSELIRYVEDNVNAYIEKTFLKLESNTLDPENKLVELLNNAVVTVENKKSIVQKLTSKIAKLASVPNSTWEMLVASNKVVAVWKNLLDYYNFSEAKITTFLIGFLNNKDNAMHLAGMRMPTEVDGKNEYGAFCKAILNESSINDDSFELVIRSSPWRYSDLDLLNHSSNKIRSLISNRRISSGKGSFDYLKASFNDSFYHIALLEKNKEEYFMKPTDFALDGKDIYSILKSTGFTPSEKAKVLASVDSEIIVSHLRNLEMIAELLKKNKTFAVSDAVFKQVINHADSSVGDRVRLFIDHSHQIGDANSISEFLNSLGSPYSSLTATAEEIELTSPDGVDRILDALKGMNYILDYVRKKEKFIVKKVKIVSE